MGMLLVWFLGLCLIILLTLGAALLLRSLAGALALARQQRRQASHVMSVLYSRPASDSGPFPVDATLASSALIPPATSDDLPTDTVTGGLKS